MAALQWVAAQARPLLQRPATLRKPARTQLARLSLNRSSSIKSRRNAGFLFVLLSTSRLLGDLPPIESTVLIGNANPLERAVQYLAKRSLRVHRRIVALANVRGDQVLQATAIDIG